MFYVQCKRPGGPGLDGAVMIQGIEMRGAHLRDKISSVLDSTDLMQMSTNGHGNTREVLGFQAQAYLPCIPCYLIPTICHVLKKCHHHYHHYSLYVQTWYSRAGLRPHSTRNTLRVVAAAGSKTTFFRHGARSAL